MESKGHVGVAVSIFGGIMGKLDLRESQMQLLCFINEETVRDVMPHRTSHN